MARPRKVTTDAPVNIPEGLATALENINKKFGQGSIMFMGNVEHKKVDVISTGSIMIDKALGIMGFPRGRIVVVEGQPSGGKSSLMLSTIAQAQKAGLVCAYIDYEYSYDVGFAKILGVDTDKLIVSQPDDAEGGMMIVEELIASKEVALIVVDSTAAMVTRAEISGEIGDATIAQLARLMSATLRRFTGPVAQANTCLVFINQLRTNLAIGGYGATSDQGTGGKALRFAASIRLDVRAAEPIKVAESQVGHKMKVKVAKNKMAAPFKVAEASFYYDRGFDYVADLLTVAIDEKVVTRSGAWMYYKGDQVSQGFDKLIQAVKENADLFKSIETDVLAVFNPVEEAPTDEEKKDQTATTEPTPEVTPEVKA